MGVNGMKGSETLLPSQRCWSTFAPAAPERLDPAKPAEPGRARLAGARRVISVADEIESLVTTVGGLHTYLARPAGGSASGMLLLPMVTGINVQVREWADELARHGVTALAWDPWQGRPSADETPPEVLFEWMGKLDDETCLAEQRQLLDHLFTDQGCA